MSAGRGLGAAGLCGKAVKSRWGRGVGKCDRKNRKNDVVPENQQRGCSWDRGMLARDRWMESTVTLVGMLTSGRRRDPFLTTEEER